MSLSKTEHLRILITERLSAAADEIFGCFERTIADYEEEIRSSQRRIACQSKLLDVLLNPVVKLHRADPQKFTLSKQEVSPEQQHCEQEMSPSLDQEDPEPPQIKEEVPPEQQHCEQERSPSLDQEDPEPPQIKEEQEVWTSQEGQRFNELREEETDTKDSMLTSTKRRFAIQRGSMPASVNYSIRFSNLRLSYTEPHCEQERSPSLDQEDPEPPQIKEEEEEVWTSQEGEQLRDLKEEETGAMSVEKDTSSTVF
ncbi:uncharacterized protein FYW47_015130 [Aplochiton taeniatus]